MRTVSRTFMVWGVATIAVVASAFGVADASQSRTVETRVKPDGSLVVHGVLVEGAAMGAELAPGVSLAPAGDASDNAGERNNISTEVIVSVDQWQTTRRAGRGHVKSQQLRGSIEIGADLAAGVTFAHIAAVSAGAPVPQNAQLVAYPRYAEQGLGWMDQEPFEWALDSAGLLSDSSYEASDPRRFALKYRSTSLNRLPLYAAVSMLGQNSNLEGAADLYAFQRTVPRPVVVDAAAYPTRMLLAHHPSVFGPSARATVISLSPGL